MFPFQSGELSFQVSNDVDYTNNNIYNYNHYPNVEQDHVNASHAFAADQFLQFNHASNSVAKNPCTRKLRSGNSIKFPNNYNYNNHSINNKAIVNDTNEGMISGSDVAQKKIIHREIERQRRREMATLFSSLQSALPMKYTKGKRSMSDHIAESTKYIKDLEMNIKDLRDKRNRLKASCSPSTIERNLHGEIGALASSTSSSSRKDVNVSIHTFSKAIEIEISAGVAEESAFPLSKVLSVLTQEGLDVVSCVSSEVSKKRIYVIHVQVEDVASIDLYQLQCRLHSKIFQNDP